MEDGGIEIPKDKPRPILRIGLFLISHSFAFSLFCCIGGVLAILLLPVIAKTTHISENALMPGSANSMMSSIDIQRANQLMKLLASLRSSTMNQGMEIQGLIAKHMAYLGAETCHHKLKGDHNRFPGIYFTSEHNPSIGLRNTSCLSHGINTVGIIRAPRGDGKEAIVLLTPYNSTLIGDGEIMALGITYSVFSLLSRVDWLAKDLIWLAPDSRHGEYYSVASWLKDYHDPHFGEIHDPCKDTTDIFRRAGTMAAALVIKVSENNIHGRDVVRVWAEASNGQMPNLDLVNVVSFLALHRHGLHVVADQFMVLAKSKWVRAVGVVFNLIGDFIRGLNPRWSFGISAEEYSDSFATMAHSLYAQAVGVPTGSHGAFREYQIDAVTVDISPSTTSLTKARKNDFLLRCGRLAEGSVRSVNNLLEKFHHSCFLYLMTSPTKYVSVGVYIIPFALLLAPLPVHAASLYLSVDRPRKWVPPTAHVFAAYIYSATIFFFLSPGCPPPAIFSLLIFPAVSGRRQGWAVLKAVTVAAAFIGLSLMSIVNFGAALLGAFWVVPACLMARPLRGPGGILWAGCTLVWIWAGFPPGGFDGWVGLTLFWEWAGWLRAWDSATYMYLGLVHVPCWLLCLCVILA